jgi:predicted RNA-binding protein associated with RNAse of E/G family
MQSWKRRKSRLLAALREGKISQAEYELAWRETSRLVAEIERGEFKLLEMSKTHLSMLKYQM